LQEIEDEKALHTLLEKFDNMNFRLICEGIVDTMAIVTGSIDFPVIDAPQLQDVGS
jgi:hypothetical protein